LDAVGLDAVDEGDGMQLELSAEDRATLEEIVERALSEMRVEVRRTSTPKYHDELRADEERVTNLLERIKALAS
jgi:hypothetical protein